MTLASLLPWKRVKPADPMQQVQPADPAQPTVKEMERIAERYKIHADLWKRVATNTDKLRLQAVAERDATYAKLREIAAAETPSCAAIGKKMARIAREALPEYAAADRETA